MKSIVLSSIISLDNDKIVGKSWKFCFWPSRNLLPNQLSFKLNYETFCFIIPFMNHASHHFPMFDSRHRRFRITVEPWKTLRSIRASW